MFTETLKTCVEIPKLSLVCKQNLITI